jgi:hypothetical protein
VPKIKEEKGKRVKIKRRRRRGRGRRSKQINQKDLYGVSEEYMKKVKEN